MADTDRHIVILGIGYTGLPLAVAQARLGRQVTGFDISTERVEAVNALRSPVDTVLDSDLASVSGNLTATTDPSVLAEADVVVVCAPTPVREDDQPDLVPLESAIATVRDHLKPGQLVIVESTTYPGTTDGLLLPILEESGLLAGVDFDLAYSPERIDPGNANFDLSNTPRLVGGLTDQSRDRAAEFYRGVTLVHLTKGMREAEAAKILENTFRQVNIALVNEFAQLCHSMELDVWDTIKAAATKPYGFKVFWPGPGVGGHCIPADPLYLVHHATTLGLRFKMAETAHNVNKGMPLWVADRVCKHLEDRSIAVDGANVLVLGVTYKPDVADTRETPAEPIVHQFLERGASVSFHDPYVDVFAGLQCVPDLAEAMASADLVVLLQPHREYTAEVLGAAERLFDTTGAAGEVASVTSL
ncbi:nucleotide sugar dehydrogenase [Amycolatopsis nalaikhensis]|uniref:Nucleotide sugar dehydrogenase n=1 Tax=Amycolatopsis nalaikhensis TaxID=715472 RepID=A0ABY8Y319_9PSEU|nr:nucleotide sugar dehydrogenase [Amycolatopsis sp. 2-2]WIV61930.1 nucleotide sugar dehydrogenase [Amycolatopsis sp. 2-2]